MTSMYYRNIAANIRLNEKPENSERDRKIYEWGLEQCLDKFSGTWEENNEYFDYAAVLYDYFTERIVIGDNRIVILENNLDSQSIHLSDYLNKEEILSLSDELLMRLYNYSGKVTVWLDENNDPVAFALSDKRKSAEKKIILDKSRKESRIVEATIYCPKRMTSKDRWIERWTEWMNNEILQEELFKAKERIMDLEFNEYKTDSLIIHGQTLYSDFLKNNKLQMEPYANLIFIATYHPWKAAMRDLKGVYFLITGLTALISFLLSKNILDTYKKQSDLEETRKSFITAMAHDLKTPLSVIRGYSENLLDNADNDRKDEYLKRIIYKTDEINEMVSKMLDISKIDSSGFEIERKELVLNDILKNVIEEYRIPAEEKTLSIDLKEENSLEMIGDEKLLEKLFSNLIDNAVSYARNESLITIFVDQNKISIFNEADPIGEEKLKNIFELKPGTNSHHGFGLYFAKKVADIHGLKLKVENNSNGISVSVVK